MVFFRDEKHRVWKYKNKRKYELCEEFNNAIQVVKMKGKYLKLSCDGEFCNISGVTKTGKTRKNLFCLDSNNIMYVYNGEIFIECMKNVKDFWTDMDIILIRHTGTPSDVYKGYICKRLYLWEHAEPIVQPEIDVHNLDSYFKTIPKKFDQQVKYKILLDDGDAGHVNIYFGIDETGKLKGISYDAESEMIEEYFEQKASVKYIRECDKDIVVFLEDGSAYIIYDSNSRSGISFKKISHPSCYPLDVSPSSYTKSARKTK